jgi:hypothetical protein
LIDASGTVVASYADAACGVLTSRSETLPNGWHTTSRSNGWDGVRSDGETGRSWMRVRADDPRVGRCIARDPLGRAPLCFADQPYADVGTHPLVNVDPSGQRRQMLDGGDWEGAASSRGSGSSTRVYAAPGNGTKQRISCRNWTNWHNSTCDGYQAWMGRSTARRFSATWGWLAAGGALVLVGSGLQIAAYVELFRMGDTGQSKLDAVLGIMGVVIQTVIPMLAMLALLAPSLSWVAPLSNGLYAAYKGLQTIVAFMRAALASAGWAVNLIFGKLLGLLGKFAGGIPGLLIGTAEMLAGEAAVQGITALGNGIEAAGWGLLTKWSWEMHSNIWDWCANNRGKCESEPQNYAMV